MTSTTMTRPAPATHPAPQVAASAGIPFSRLLRVECVEDRQQLGDDQQIGDLRCQVDQLDGALLPLHDERTAHQLTEAAAVHIAHSGEVEHDLAVALKDDARHGVAKQLGAAAGREFAFHIQDGDVVDVAFRDFHDGLHW